MLHGLPLGDHRDLQEDKEPAFDAANTLLLALPVLAGGSGDPVRHERDAEPPVTTATCTRPTSPRRSSWPALPFRREHERTGKLLSRLGEEGRSLRDLGSEEWTTFGVWDGAALLDPDRSVDARRGAGGPSSSSSVKAQVAALEALLSG